MHGRVDLSNRRERRLTIVTWCLVIESPGRVSDMGLNEQTNGSSGDEGIRKRRGRAGLRILGGRRREWKEGKAGKQP